MFRENRLLAEDFHETLYLFRNYGNMSQNVSPAAIRIDALCVEICFCFCFTQVHSQQYRQAFSSNSAPLVNLELATLRFEVKLSHFSFNKSINRGSYMSAHVLIEFIKRVEEKR